MIRTAFILGNNAALRIAVSKKMVALGCRVVAAGREKVSGNADSCALAGRFRMPRMAPSNGESEDRTHEWLDEIESEAAVDVLVMHGLAGLAHTQLTQWHAIASAAAHRMCKRGWGRLILVASTVPETIQPTDDSALADARQEIRRLAAQIGVHGVTLNIVWTDGAAAQDEATDSTPASARLSSAEEIARLVAYLASDEAAFLNDAQILFKVGRRMTHP